MSTGTTTPTVPLNGGAPSTEEQRADMFDIWLGNYAAQSKVANDTYARACGFPGLANLPSGGGVSRTINYNTFNPPPAAAAPTAPKSGLSTLGTVLGTLALATGVGAAGFGLSKLLNPTPTPAPAAGSNWDSKVEMEVLPPPENSPT